MLRRLLARRPSPAMVVALIALFVAMGGTATALQGRNTVFSDDITNGEVKSPDIRTGHVRSPDISNNNGVRSTDVRDDTLTDGGLQGVDIAPDALTGADIDESTFRTTPTGPAGGQLEGGYPNPALAPLVVGSAQLERTYAVDVTVSVPGGVEGNGDYVTRGATAECDAINHLAFGGSASWQGTASDRELTISAMGYFPSTSLTRGQRPWAFHAAGGNDTSEAQTLRVGVYCLPL